MAKITLNIEYFKKLVSNRLSRNAGWLGLAELANRFFRLGTTVTLARIFSQEDYGLMSLIYATFEFTNAFSFENGLKLKIIQASETDLMETCHTSYWLNWILCGLTVIRMSMWGHFRRHAELFSKIDADQFRFTGIGHKRRIAPISALLADADLDHLDYLNKIKQRNTKILDRELGDIEGIEIVKPASKAIRGGFYQGYPIRILNEDISAKNMINVLSTAGIMSIPYPFVLHHKLPIYTDINFRYSLMRQYKVNPVQESEIVLPVTDHLEKQLFLLPPKYFININKTTLNKIKNILKLI